MVRLPSFACFCAVLCGAGLILAMSGCDKVQSLVDRTQEALDRAPAPEEPGIVAQPVDPASIPPPPEMVKTEPEINKNAKVSVLLYHDFTTSLPRSGMVVNIDRFREHMQALKDANLPVISMSDFLAWKRGEKSIPDECVMITIDDGWKATYELAMPVLREFGYPYTLFLYKKYVGSGGRSLSHDEVRELTANGAEIASHSLSHDNLLARKGKSAEAYQEWLRQELEDSHTFLEENFGSTGKVVKVFAYPYGIYSKQVIEIGEAFGYEAMFTVNGQKTSWETKKSEVGRYDVTTENCVNFRPALAFHGTSAVSTGRSMMQATVDDSGAEKAPLITAVPADGSVVSERMPEIQLDVSKLQGVRPESIVMRVSGFGQVPHLFDPAHGLIRYQVPQRLRLENCAVIVSFSHAGRKEAEVVSWNFKVDRKAAYLPVGLDPVTPPAPAPADGGESGTAQISPE